ncbi:MAG: exodeoxyribonuclease VII small subunit [Spirochaetaceae bacterium]|jgi:exodeoxyribonuclease VII small subunit|nr:exodeoxyribonuclease VII small subunit [Spirochaetaceae bacterium]
MAETTFEQKLSRLEELGEKIKGNDVLLEDALKYFEEGIKLAKGMEKELAKIEGQIEILLNEPELDAEGKPRNKPVLELFAEMG